MATLKKLYLNGTAYDLAYDTTITIQVNGTTVKSFTLNQATGDTINIPVPTKTSDIQNDSGFITNAVNDLANYYKKTETYTQAEVNALVQNFQGFEIVATLPTTNIKTNVIYLKGPTGSGADKYEEYVYANNAWVKIGDTSVDLTNYFNTSTQTSDAITEGSTNLFVTPQDKTNWNAKADDTGVVHKTGNETINGTKTFGTSPVVPSKDTSASASNKTVIATEAQVAKKQDALATQTAYTQKGSATKVPQITTNSLGQVTGITEVNITQPSVGNGTFTVKQGGTTKGTFSANQSTAGEVDLNTSFLKTQAEYDALPSSKNTDGNFYFIYNT